MFDLDDLTFAAMVVVTIGGGITALEAREIVYGAIGLAFSFFGVAGLFFLLDAPFVAVFQITVYVGAVAVLILFTVMLVREGRWMRDSPRPWGKISGILTAVALAASLILAFAASSLLKASEQSTPPSFVNIGELVAGPYAPVLEMLALVLAAAVLGAVMLAKVEHGSDGDGKKGDGGGKGGMP
jgi:NADH:ubiquinone oxidoreductase subunit 6 (subunit J)